MLSIPVNVGFLSLMFYFIVFQNGFVLVLSFFVVVNFERRFILKWSSPLNSFYYLCKFCASFSLCLSVWYSDLVWYSCVNWNVFVFYFGAGLFGSFGFYRENGNSNTYKGIAGWLPLCRDVTIKISESGWLN